MDIPKVAVLGCGPTGLMAAHALQLAGLTPVIISRKQKSPLGGAQYLHEEIPFLTEHEPDQLRVVRYGTEEGYEKKIYGELPRHLRTSWHLYPEATVPAWSLTAVYDRLWEDWEPFIVDVQTLSHDDVVTNMEDYDAVMSTVPLPVICRTIDPTASGPPPAYAHTFRDQTVLISNEQAMHWDGENVIVYNGDPDYSWYRSSTIFGVDGTEWSDRVRKPQVPTRSIRKPLDTNCDCLPQVEKVGRYGAWRKGVLTHHGYLEAARLAKERFDRTAPLTEAMEATL